MFATLDKNEEKVKESNVLTNNTANSTPVVDNNGKKGLDLLYTTARQDAQKQQIAEKDATNEDIRPSDTTMQFAEKKAFSKDDQFAEKNIMKIEHDFSQADVSQDTEYHKNTHGKMMLVLYSVAVGVVLALIIMNSSVLSNMTKKNADKRIELAQMTEQYNSVKAELDELSSDAHVINVAEEEYNMVK